jgi:tetratricopeptide (TPR) repeat protein
MFCHAQLDIDEAISLETNDTLKANDYALKGRILIELKDFDAARSAYDIAHRTVPNHQEAVKGLADYSITVKSYKKALVYLDRYIDITEASATVIEYDVYRDRGVAKLQLHDYVGAIEDFNLGLAIVSDADNDYVNLLFLRGCAHYKSKAEMLADDDFTEVISGTNTNARSLRTHAYYMRGSARLLSVRDASDYVTAIGDFTDAIEWNLENADFSNPNEARFYSTLYATRGQVRLAIGKYAGAIDDFTNAIGCNRDNLEISDLYFARGQARIARGWDGVLKWQTLSSKWQGDPFSLKKKRDEVKRLALREYEYAAEDADLMVRHSREANAPCRDILNAAVIYAQAWERSSYYLRFDLTLRPKVKEYRNEAERLIADSIRTLIPDEREAFLDKEVFTNPSLLKLWKQQTNKDLKRRFLNWANDGQLKSDAAMSVSE